MNPFPVIRLWLEDYSVPFNVVPRDELRDWITKPTLNGDTLTIEEVYEITDVDLMLDCMIAVGIGSHLEQNQVDFTVS